jgi:ABC-2 type transport system permease protein
MATEQPRPAPVRAIIAKDLRLFRRDRFYAFITVLGLVFYVAVFWLLPAEVDETLTIGIHLPGGEALLAEGLEDSAEEGLEVVVFPSAAALEDAVRAGEDVVAGLAFPTDFLTATAAGQRTTVQVLLPGAAPALLGDALSAAVRELAAAVIGEDPPVVLPDEEALIVGVDRAGQLLPLRAQLRPMLLFVVLLVEMFALAALVAAELSQRTITAILASPARIRDVLAAKAVLGTGLALTQALLLGALTGAFSRQPFLVALVLLLGAVLVTGVGLLVGSLGHDFVAIVFWSMLAFVPLIVPAFSLLFPGSPAWWVQALPTYGLAEILVQATGYGTGLDQLLGELALLLGWCVVMFVVGAAVLARRVVRL